MRFTLLTALLCLSTLMPDLLGSALLAQQPIRIQRFDATALQLTEAPDGTWRWVARRSDNSVRVYSEDFEKLATLNGTGELVRGTEVFVLGDDQIIDGGPVNYLVNREGDSVVHIVYNEFGTQLRRKLFPRYTRSYRLTDGRVVVQERTQATGEQIIYDIRDYSEVVRFDETVRYTNTTGEDLWYSRAQDGARVYTISGDMRSEATASFSGNDLSPAFNFGLGDIDLFADGKLDFQATYKAPGSNSEDDKRFRVYDESGKLIVDKAEKQGEVLGVTQDLSIVHKGDALVSELGKGSSFIISQDASHNGRELFSEYLAPVATSEGNFLVGLQGRGLTGTAIVYDSNYSLRRIIEPSRVADLAMDDSVVEFAFAVAAEDGTTYGDAPLAFVSYGENAEPSERVFYLVDVTGEVRFEFPAESMRMVTTGTNTYLITEVAVGLRDRRFDVYQGPKAINTSDANEAPRGEWTVFPNPVSTTLTLTGETAEPIDLRIYDALGRVVVRQNAYVPGTGLDVEQLSKGIFTVEARNAEGEVVLVERLVVTR